MEDACTHMKEWKIEELRASKILYKLDWNYHKNILKEISTIELSAIKSIIVQENCIESIEFVSRISMPNLTSFWISSSSAIKIKI